MTIKQQVVSMLKERTAEIQQTMAEIKKLEDRKKNDHLDFNYIQREIDPKIGDLRVRKNNQIDSAWVALRNMTEAYREQVRNSHRLEGGELTDDAKLFSFPGLLKQEDIEAIMDRNDGNHTMLQLAERYAEQNGIKINRVYDSGKAAEINAVNDLEGVGNIYLRHWVTQDNAVEMMTRFFGDE